MEAWAKFYGPSAGYMLELYDRCRQDPQSVGPDARALFERWSPPTNGTAPAAVSVVQAGPARGKNVAATHFAPGDPGKWALGAPLHPFGRGPPAAPPPPPGNPALP